MSGAVALPRARRNYLIDSMSIRPVPDLSRPVHDILGLPFDAVDHGQALETVLRSVASRVPLFVSTPNLNFLIATQSDPEFRASVCQSDLSLADGMPVVWLARLLGAPIRQRVAGSDLFEALRDQQSQTVRVFFFGGPEGAAQRAGEQLNAIAAAKRAAGHTPGLICVGHESPGFGSLEEMSTPEQLDRINGSRADFIIVALGARKGQAWIQRNRSRLEAPVISHLGAVVNMAAGTIDRAPRWMQRLGLEWVWRIKEEPLLWKRYAGDGLAIARLLLTRVLPDMLRRRRSLQEATLQTHPPVLTESTSAAQQRLVLQGIWTASDLGRIRASLAEAWEKGEAPVVDASRAVYLDTAIRGLLAISSKAPDHATS